VKTRIEKFGLNVRFFRTRLKLSQDELAEKAELHRTYIGAVERGERNICLTNIFRLADALEVKAKDLFEEDLDIGKDNQ
jgi:transcriptional regulator with XRE-family HTH domain